MNFVSCGKSLKGCDRMNIRDELIKIRTIMDFDIPKAKQLLTNLIKEIK